MAFITDRLRERIDRFLPTLRLGVDFGQTTGGIGLVRDREILHAEAFVDFHDSTLETRRTLRRGRRTRSSKKMRLARLRSWVLRQRLPDGSRLPDPYRVMWDIEGGFQTKPGLYKTKGRSPGEYDTWIEVAKKGEVDPAGFVCALTHLFQKRGYKYDQKDLDDFTTERLIDFLNSCCLLAQAPELEKQMRAEVERRNKAKLLDAFETALTRPPEPRKAVPRQIKEQELRTMIEMFGRKHNISSQTTARWQKELCGLLNRILREARFDNRLKSGCAWCGKKTARLKKPEVREKAYLAAIANLRVRRAANPRLTRELNSTEHEPLVNWWNRRQLSRVGQHEFSKGKRVDVFERAPTRENIEKAFDKLGIVKTWLRDKRGKPYVGYAMLSQIDNLLNHVPRSGRASLCMEHLAFAANGKHMKDAGVEWQRLKVRRAPNPCLEQHDARVMKRIERLLFVRGKRGEDAWRHGRVALITLEVPEPQTERVGKRQQTERQALDLRGILHQETGGVCIYQNTPSCRARDGKIESVAAVEKDHIFPRHRGGPDLRLNLVCACRECNHPDSGKGHRLPSEWIQYGSESWRHFEARVNALRSLPERKKQLLLARDLDEAEQVLADPTSLAHVGARPRAFIAELIEIFRKYGVEPPRVDYQLGAMEGGAPHVQRVEGRWTTDLRLAWMWKDRDARQVNFGPKDRTDLYNHAQDAVLLAATPPHTWRKQILVETARRHCARRDQNGHIIVDERGDVQTELRDRPGLALLDLAPDWAAFMARRSKPLVTVLGKIKANWRRQIMDQSFYQDPDSKDDAFLKIHKPVEDAGAEGKMRHKTVRVPKGGLVVQVPYTDPATRSRRMRKVQVKPIASIAAIFWQDDRRRLKISLERPRAIHEFVEHPIEPPLPDGVRPIARWERGDTIRLDAANGFEAGFYRVKELAEGEIIVIPENNVTAAIAQRLQLPKDEIQTRERKLRKAELSKLFAGL